MTTSDKPAREALAALRAADTALVLVHPGELHEPAALAAASRLLAGARSAELLVLFVLRADEVLPASMQPQPSAREQVVRVEQAGGFGGSTLPLLLRCNAVRNVVLAGGNAGLDVALTAREAMARGYRCLLAGDAVDGPAMRPAAPQAAVAELLQRWQAEPAGERGWQPLAKQRAWLRTLQGRLDPAHTALVLIDVQNDFCAAAGASGRREGIPLVAAAAQRIPLLLAGARAAGCLVVHVRAEYGGPVRGVGSPYRFPSSAAREGAVWSLSAAEMEGGEFESSEVEVCRPGTWGAELLNSVAPRPGELQVTKHRFSAFIDTPLEAMLRLRGIRSLVFAGVTTNCCIESSVRDASMLDFYTVVVQDCTGTKDSVRHLHAASLEQMATYFAQVRTADEVESAWASHRQELAA